MAKGLAREARRAVLTEAKAQTPITDLVSADSIFPQATPKADDIVWPFIKMGAFSSTPLRAPGCLDGADIRGTVHCFAKSTLNTAGAKTDEAEDNVDAIIKAIESTFDGKILDTPSGQVKMRWLSSQALIDQSEADAFHGVIDFRLRALAE